MRLAVFTLALCLAACAPDVKVVTKIQFAEPAPPSADLLAEPAVPVTAGSKNVAEAIARVSASNKDLRKTILGWQVWYADMLKSIRDANEGAGKERRQP